MHDARLPRTCKQANRLNSHSQEVCEKYNPCITVLYPVYIVYIHVPVHLSHLYLFLSIYAKKLQPS